MARWLVAALLLGLTPSRSTAADLSDAAARAYDQYFAAARHAFVELATAVPMTHVGGDGSRSTAGTVRAGTGDGILSNPDSLVHHWHGEIFLPGVTLEQVLTVSQAYSDYPRIFRPIRAATVLPSPDRALRVRFRMKASGGGLSATLDVRTRIEWTRVDNRRAYVVSSSEEIHEVADAGKASERLLPAGHDSGYLWRASSMTRFVAQDDGVWMAMETVGLSRPFPPFLGWVIEPIARRVGRGSVGESMREFARAVGGRSKLSP